MRIEIWIAIGLIGLAYLVWRWRSGRGTEDVDYKEEVTDFMITPKKTVNRDTVEDTDADAFERDGGIYKLKTFTLDNGEKISVHSQENPLPHGLAEEEKDVEVKDKDGEKKERPLIDIMASRTFVSGALDNLTTVAGGGLIDIFGYLRKVPGEAWFVLLVLIIIFAG